MLTYIRIMCGMYFGMKKMKINNSEGARGEGLENWENFRWILFLCTCLIPVARSESEK